MISCFFFSSPLGTPLIQSIIASIISLKSFPPLRLHLTGFNHNDICQDRVKLSVPLFHWSHGFFHFKHYISSCHMYSFESLVDRSIQLCDVVVDKAAIAFGRNIRPGCFIIWIWFLILCEACIKILNLVATNPLWHAHILYQMETILSVDSAHHQWKSTYPWPCSYVASLNKNVHELSFVYTRQFGKMTIFSGLSRGLPTLKPKDEASQGFVCHMGRGNVMH